MASRSMKTNTEPDSMRATLDKARAARDARVIATMDERIDRRVTSLLGHHRKFFEGSVTVEKLGPLYGGYGTFLPTEVKGNPVKGEVIFNGGNIYDHLQPGKFKWQAEFMNATSIARHAEVIPPREGYPIRFNHDAPSVADLISNGAKCTNQNAPEKSTMLLNQDNLKSTDPKSTDQKSTVKNPLNKTMLPPPIPLKNMQKTKNPENSTLQKIASQQKAEEASGKVNGSAEHVKIKGQIIPLKMINFPVVIKGFFSELFPHSSKSSPLDDDCKSFSQNIKSFSGVSVSKNLKSGENNNESQSMKKETADDIEEGEVRETETLTVKENVKDDSLNEVKDGSVDRKDVARVRDKEKLNLNLRNNLKDMIVEKESNGVSVIRKGTEEKERKEGKDNKMRREYEETEQREKSSEKDEKNVRRGREKKEEGEVKKAKLDEERMAAENERKREEDEKKKMEGEKIKIEDEKKRRIEEKQKKEEEEKRRRIREEKERKMEEAKRRKVEEENRRKEVEERKKEEEERKRKEEEEEKKRKEEMERKLKEEEQKRRKEEEKKLEEERKRKEEEERRIKKDYERRKAQEEAEEKDREELLNERMKRKEISARKVKEEEKMKAKEIEKDEEELRRKQRDRESKLAKEEKKRIEEELAEGHKDRDKDGDRDREREREGERKREKDRGRNKSKSREGEERRAMKDKSVERERMMNNGQGRELNPWMNAKVEKNKPFDDHSDADADEYEETKNDSNNHNNNYYGNNSKFELKDKPILSRKKNTKSNLGLKNSKEISPESEMQVRKRNHEDRIDEYLDEKSQRKSNLSTSEERNLKNENASIKESIHFMKKEKQNQDESNFDELKPNLMPTSKLNLSSKPNTKPNSKPNLKDSKKKTSIENTSKSFKNEKSKSQKSTDNMLIKGSKDTNHTSQLGLVPIPIFVPNLTYQTTVTETITATSQELDNWVECDACKIWRLLPPTVNPDHLPDNWTCSMSDWMPELASCSIPYEVTINAVYASLGFPLPHPVLPEHQANILGPGANVTPIHSNLKDHPLTQKQTLPPLSKKKKTNSLGGKGASMAPSPSPSLSASASPSGLAKPVAGLGHESGPVGQVGNKKPPLSKKSSDNRGQERDMPMKLPSKFPPLCGRRRERSVEMEEKDRREESEGREGKERRESPLSKSPSRMMKQKSDDANAFGQGTNLKPSFKRSLDVVVEEERKAGGGGERDGKDVNRNLDDNDGRNSMNSKRLKVERRDKEDVLLKKEEKGETIHRSSSKEKKSNKSSHVNRNEDDRIEKNKKNQTRKELSPSLSPSPFRSSSPALTPLKNLSNFKSQNGLGLQKEEGKERGKAKEKYQKVSEDEMRAKGRESSRGYDSPERSLKRKERRRELYEEKEECESAKKRSKPFSNEMKMEMGREEWRGKERNEISSKEKDDTHKIHHNHQNQKHGNHYNQAHDIDNSHHYSKHRGDGYGGDDDDVLKGEKVKIHGSKYEKGKYEKEKKKKRNPSSEFAGMDVDDVDVDVDVDFIKGLNVSKVEKDAQQKGEFGKSKVDMLPSQQRGLGTDDDNQNRLNSQNHTINTNTNSNSNSNILNAKAAMNEAIALKRQGNEKTEKLERTDLYMKSSLKFLESMAHDESQKHLYVSTAAMLEHCGNVYECLNQMGGAIVAYKCAAILRSRFLHFQTIPSASDQTQILSFFEQSSHDATHIHGDGASKVGSLENGSRSAEKSMNKEKKDASMAVGKDAAVLLPPEAIPFRKSLLIPSSYMIKSAKELYAMNADWNKATNLSVSFLSSIHGGDSSSISSLKSLGENNGLNPLKDSIKLAYRALSDFKRL